MQKKIWFKKLLSINISSSYHLDLPKILVLFYCIENNSLNCLNKISELNKYIYRFNIDNLDLAEKNPYSIIKNIKHYSVNDIIHVTMEALNTWKNDNSLSIINEKCFKFNIMDYDNDTLIMTKNIMKIIFKKNTNLEFNYNSYLNELNNIRTYDLNLLNNTRLVNRVYEKSNYCVCCDSVEDLKIVNLSNNLQLVNNINNYVFLCKDHYELYIDNYFNFDVNGKIIIYKNNDILDYRMRISSELLKKLYTNHEK